jgi:multicomponent Na+:H+ antiporter subunit D
MLVRESFAQGHYLWGGLALAVGVLTLYSMVKIWLEGFWKPHPKGKSLAVSTTAMPLEYAVVLVFVTLLALIGVYPEPLIQYATSATDTLWSRGQ